MDTCRKAGVVNGTHAEASAVDFQGSSSDQLFSTFNVINTHVVGIIFQERSKCYTFPTYLALFQCLLGARGELCVVVDFGVVLTE